jgi:hypothetical protein
VVSCDGAEDARYSITYLDGTVTVTKRSITVTGSSSVIDQTDAAPSYGYSFTGFVGNDGFVSSPVCASTYSSASNFGSYAVTCSGAAVSANYQLDYVAGALTVRSLLSTFTIDGASVNTPNAIKRLPSGSASITVDAVARNSSNSVFIDSPDLLVSGPNQVMVTIFAPDGSTLATYEVTVIIDAPVLDPNTVVIPTGSTTATLENGNPVATTTTTNSATGAVTVGGSGWTATVYGQNSNGATPLNSGKILITGDAGLVLSGTGYAPNTTVKIYSFSTPVLLGTFTTDSNGRFVGTVYLPIGLAAGEHSIQMNGVASNQKARSVSVAITVAAGVAKSSAKSIFFGFKSVAIGVAAKKSLNALRASLKGGANVVVTVTGYCVAGSTKASDVKLAQVRAKNIVAAMKKLGINATFRTSTLNVKNIPSNVRRAQVNVSWTKK